MKISLSNQEGLPTLYQRFWENAKIAPTSLAIIDDTSDVSTTYATLLADASEVAARIIAAVPQLLPEEPVCILMPRCQEQVLSQLAVLQSNACCVPIDPGLPPQRKETMMQRLGIRVVLQLDSGSPSRVRVQIRHTEEKRPLPPLSKSHIDRMTHIIHTSGTTGPPKAVQLLEKGLLRFLNGDHFTLRREDRMAHLAMPSFDLSLFEVWGTFLSGATLVIVPPQVARDPNALCSAFRRHQVSFAGLPTALFNLVSRVRPETFNTLRSVMFGGEATNLQAVKSVLRVAPSTLSLFTCYGPTECSVFALCYKLNPAIKDVQEDACIPIGAAYDKTTVFRVMDDFSKEVFSDAPGELYIGGECVARGYFNQPDITKQKFIVIDGTRWYRTGDQVRWIKGVVGGLLEYVGRLDNQVKLRGLRFELEEIDNTVLGHGSVASCATVLVRATHAEPFLVAFIVVKNNLSPSFSEERLLIHLRNTLPTYMIPRLRCQAELPLTLNGKVDRQALSAGYLETLIGPPIQAAPSSENDPVAVLTHIWKEVLTVPKIDLDSNLFLLGASSISVVTVSYRFRKAFGRELPAQTIYDYPSIRQLASVLCNDKAGVLEYDGSSPSPSITHTLLKDSKIADSIIPAFPVNLMDITGDKPNAAFITGVTGFLGAYMLSELLQNPAITLIYALVRASSESVAIKRLQHNLQRYHLLAIALPSFSKLRVLPGCLEDDMFGVSDSLYQELVQNVQIVYHFGAKVNYAEPYSLHRPANVIGTRNMIRFAATLPLKPLQYVSSISVYGPVGLSQAGSYVSEDADLHLYLENMEYDTGYTQSQWVAEEMIRRSMDRGILASVYRPGHILGGQPRYLGNTEDFVHRLIQGCREIGAWPYLPDQKKLFIPVDYTAATILQISSTPEAIGRCFNIVPPDNEQSTHIDGSGLFEILRRNGIDMMMLSYPEWVEKLENSETLQENRLFAVLPMLKTPVHQDGRTTWEVYADMPTYGTKNTEWALHQSGSSAIFPMLDEAYYMKCFGHILG